ncbi:MAG: NERD domain-containing protein [Bacillota bacterium]|nr:NERD domain-containing protein [Bacillota bacterium]
MGIIRFIDDIASYVTSDIKTQTGKGFLQTFMNSGNYGEFQSYKYLFMTPGKREFIHNCYLPIENGFTEIDLLLIHETGLYVVESKNYSGWIFGDEKQKEWTQILAGGKQKNRFFNPVWQNAGHIKALREYFREYQDIPMFSLIVFSERCELKKVTFHSEEVFIIKRNQLKSVFKKQIKGKTTFPVEMMTDIYQRLLPLCKRDEEEKLQHIDRINDLKHPTLSAVALEEPAGSVIENDNHTAAYEAIKIEADKANENNCDTMPEATDDQRDKATLGLCPRCGASLVERKGKNGPFIGCSGFPKCRFTTHL